MSRAIPATDHGLLALAYQLGVARWEPFSGGVAGELCAGGLRTSTRLDYHGLPRLGGVTRKRLGQLIRDARSEADQSEENLP